MILFASYLLKRLVSGIHKKQSGHDYYFKSENEVSSLNLQSPIQGYFLTVSVHEQFKIAGATAPIDNSVVFYDYKNKKILKRINLKKPMGITLSQDQKYFIVTSYEGIKFVSIPDLSITRTLFPNWEMEQSHPATFLLA